MEFLRDVSAIVKKSHLLKLSSRQVDSAFKMTQNDGTRVFTATGFGAVTECTFLAVFKCVMCDVECVMCDV